MWVRVVLHPFSRYLGVALAILFPWGAALLRSADWHFLYLAYLFLFDWKKAFISAAHSSSFTLPITFVLGCSTAGCRRLKPNLCSGAPYTSVSKRVHAIAPAHIAHGSTVT